MIGFGTEQVASIPADDQGRMCQATLAAELARTKDPVIVSVQAGNVNSGAFESVPATADLLAGRNSWLHVDGAFGLWAAATPRLRHLVEGIEWADSWATDAHKWLNVPYDSGIVIVRRAADHQGLKTARCAYAGQASETQRDGSTWVPENSRRARAFALYAGLRALGRSGVQLLVERSVALAQRFAEQAARLPFATIANQVVLNQVLVRFEPPGEYDRDILHAALASEIQREGTCWIGAGRWRGHAVLRVSVSNWSTDETAIDDAVTSLARAVEKVFAEVPSLAP
jgi:glutamate/tyrosine decarboxylase-like PLP-dependent enzyme